MFTDHKKARAKIVQRGNTPCLLAVFDASTPPMIWQFDLEKMANYTITLREKDGEWDLGIALPQGTFTNVAHFDERTEAEAAYATVRSALLKNRSNHVLHINLRIVVLIAAIAFALFYFLPFKSAPRTPAQPEIAVHSPFGEMPTNPSGPKEIQPGVPMSADDVLTPPQD